MQRWRNRPPGSNWGEFGPDDQRGRMNLLTPERRRAALREATEGIAFCLSLPLDYPGPELMLGRRPPQLFCSDHPLGDHYNATVADGFMHACDIVCDDGVILSTQYSTQCDSLAHWGQRFDADGDGVDEVVYYNGFRGGQELIAPGGGSGPYAKALGIENLAEATPQGRGVLIDLHARYGLTRVAVGHDDLMSIIDEQGVEIRTGDFLVLYTGVDDVILNAKKKVDMMGIASCAGLDGTDPKLLDWITESGVVALCSDHVSVETVPFMDPTLPGTALPLHELCLFKLGIHLGELWRLSELAAWLRANRRWSFLLTAPPLRLPGAVGSPACPIATV
jgi:kynurenine formamidase